MFQTGFHNTPVDSIAMCVTRCWVNQSDNANSSPVIVPNVRISSTAFPSAPVIRTHATTVF